MTCLQGYIVASYDRLVELFGEPTEGDGYKVDAEWIVEFEDGTVATIYNWKNGRNYCGHEGYPIELITDWNIGGYKKQAVRLVDDVLSGVIDGEYTRVNEQKLLA
jgi:antitoxin component YwqK of YwqJK toxin-antitoxin module